MSFSYAKFIARRGGVVLASGPPVESVPGPTRCCRDHSLQTWRSLKHEVNTIHCVLFMFSAIRRYNTCISISVTNIFYLNADLNTSSKAATHTKYLKEIHLKSNKLFRILVN